MKYHLPESPEARAEVWRESLRRIDQARWHVGAERIQLDLAIIDLENREAMGETLRSERSALKKREIENRMKELCLDDQELKLMEAIHDLSI
ncbi:MAG TPA: hypothetical protein PKJ51_01825 [Methanothrix sp.]|jgi:hypothetical protein|nr:hypothetical protein [Methanothrix sp.]